MNLPNPTNLLGILISIDNIWLNPNWAPTLAKLKKEYN